MRTIRVFVSSPRDVGNERALANAVIERLHFEFRGIVDLQPVFWEQLPMLATDTFQAQIPKSSDADICVFILWSWFGTPLPEHFRKPDGAAYRSGTEFEFESALAVHAVRGTPDILVYRKTAEPRTSIRDREQVLEQLAQRDAVQAFIDEYFHGDGGTFKAAFRIFESSAEFEEMLETHLRELIREKLRDIAGVAEARWTTSPFRGLAAFDVADAVIFCGRTQAVTEVIEALNRQDQAGHPLVLVCGASGAGKSSLARAGVLPMLVQPRVVDGVGVWRRAILRPSEAATPTDALAAALLRDGALPELAAGGLDAAKLAALLADTPAAVAPLLALTLARLAEPPLRAALVLLVDQMEELFAPTLTRSQRDAFATALAMLARGGIWLVATVRADFQPRLAELPDALADLLRGDGVYNLRPPRAGEVAQMIRRPAQMAGLVYEHRPDSDEGLDDVLRDAAIADPAALPLLQFALEQLWERRDGRLLRFADYEALGGLDGAVSSRAEAVFAALPPVAQAALPRVLSALVRVEVTDDASRVSQRRASRAALDTAPGAASLVDGFIAARLFVVDRTEDNEAAVGVVHEALLRVWPRALAWTQGNERALQARTRVTAAEALWRHAAEPADLLLTGTSLAEAQALGADGALMLLGSTERFIAASSRAARARRRTLRLRLTAAAALLLAMLGTGGWYWDGYVAERASAYPLNFVRRFGQWQANTPPITEQDASHRYGYLRIVRHGRAGPVVRADVLNGSGACPLRHDIGTLFGPGEPLGRHICHWGFEMADGRIMDEFATDVHGERAWSLVYSDAERTAAGVFASDGRAVALAGNGVSRLRFDHQVDGVATRIRFFDAYGHPQRVTSGAYGLSLTYDAGWRLVDLQYLGPSGERSPLAGGVAGQHLLVDGRGRTVEAYAEDLDGKPVIQPPSFVARTRSTFDEHDNQLSVAFFDQADKPVRGVAGWAVLQNRYDGRGNITDTRTLDEHGQLVRPNGSGAAVVRRDYDGQGRAIRTAYFDEHDKPLALSGSFSEASAYDEFGQLVRLTGMDAAGKPTRNADGVVTQILHHDASGRQDDVRFLDEFDKPTIARNGTSGFRQEFDEFDNVVRFVNLGQDGQPILLHDGAAETRHAYDERNNRISSAFYGADGKPMLLRGVFRRLDRVDTDGRVTRESYEALDGEPGVTADGSSAVAFTYDSSGNTIEVAYFGIDGKPIDQQGKCARILKTYDQSARVTSVTCLGAAGTPVLGVSGWSRETEEFDAAGRQTASAFFDADGKPMVGKGHGYASLRATYDAAENVTEVIWRDAAGNVAGPNGGCGHIRVAYENGRRSGSRCVEE